jgi:2-dehydro-3-deoxygluconokinase
MEKTSVRFAAIGECMIEFAPENGNLYQMNFAGDTLNTAVYLARCSDPKQVSVEFLTALGQDPYSGMMIKEWQEENVGSHYVQRLPGLLPGLYLIRTDAHGERSFYYYRLKSAARQMLVGVEGDRLCHKILDFDYLYFSGITLGILDSLSREKFYNALLHAKQNGCTICFDTNYRPKLWRNLAEAKEVLNNFLPLVDIALPSFDDEKLLHGDLSLEACAKRLQAHGIREVVVKHSGEGCLLSFHNIQKRVPVPTIEKIVDTTGAGDSFNGAYLAARIRNLPPEQAAQQGALLAAAVIAHHGAIIDKQFMPKQ